MAMVIYNVYMQNIPASLFLMYTALSSAEVQGDFQCEPNTDCLAGIERIATLTLAQVVSVNLLFVLSLLP